MIGQIKLRQFLPTSHLLHFMLLLILASMRLTKSNIVNTDNQGTSMQEQKAQLQVGAATIKTALSSNQFEGSGANPDDEDGDVVEGSGDGFEGSGVPPESNNDKGKLAHNIKKPEKSLEKEQKSTTTASQNMQSKLTNSNTGQTTTTTTALITTTTAAPTTPRTAHTPLLRTSTTSTPFIPPPPFVPIKTEQTPSTTALPTPRPQPPPYILDPTITLEQLKPGMFALIIGAIVVFVLLVILLATYIMYRIRKKDEGSYSCEEPSMQPHHYSYAYQKASIKEFYA